MKTNEAKRTCDRWGHCDDDAPTEFVAQEVIWCDCDLWGHPCPHRALNHPTKTAVLQQQHDERGA